MDLQIIYRNVILSLYARFQNSLLSLVTF